nr:reverse transcriptase domain-containing protein [Tanacetum cinerariifolium]
EVQSLNGKLANLNRFLSKSAEKSLPLFQTLKKLIKKSDFHWTAEAKQAFQQLKQHLSKLPLLVAPTPQEELIIYLFATYGAISAVLVTERGTAQMPIYFISHALQGPELNYSPMEKLVLSLVFAAKRLRRPRTSVKGQTLADFLTKMPGEDSQTVPAAETQEEPNVCGQRRQHGEIHGNSQKLSQRIYHLLNKPSTTEQKQKSRRPEQNPVNQLRVLVQTGTSRSAQRQIHKGEGSGNGDRGRWTDLDETVNGLLKRRSPPQRQEEGKKAPPQGPTIRVNGGGPLQTVIPYAVVKIRRNAPGGVCNKGNP